MFMKKGVFIFVTIVMLILSACSASTAGTDTGQKKDGGKRTDLTIGLEADAVTLLANTDVNYVTDVQIRSIYDPLIDRDEKGGFIPGLATSWKNIDDHTWQFELRKGVKFQDGKQFTANDVKANIDYILDEKNNSFYRSRWTNITEAKVINDYTVQIITKDPFPTLLDRIAGDLLIMDMDYVKKVGADEAAKKPVGTGAYKVKDWVRDQKLDLVANEKYWDGTPKIKKLTFKYIPEFNGRLSAFLNGEIQLFMGVPTDSQAPIENNPDSKIANVGSARIQYIALNTFFNGPLKKKEVRQALNYAVDVKEINKTIMGGDQIVINGPLSKVNADYVQTTGYEYNPDKAVELLKQAGYKPSDLTLRIDTSNGGPMDSQVVQAIGAELNKIGIKTDIKMNEWGAFLGDIRQRSMHDMFILSWGPSFEAQSTIENLFTKDAPYSSFYDPEVEAMIKKAIPIVDPTTRKDAFAKIQQKLVDDAAWIPLWQQTDKYAVAKDLNFTPRPDQRYVVKDMRWK